MLPRSATTTPRPPRSRRLAELAFVLLLTEAVHLLRAGRAPEFGAPELAVGGMLLAGWLVRHTLEALRPRQRVHTWNKPRGLGPLSARR